MAVRRATSAPIGSLLKRATLPQAVALASGRSRIADLCSRLPLLHKQFCLCRLSTTLGVNSALIDLYFQV